MIAWVGRRLAWGLHRIGHWYNSRPYWKRELTVEERLDRLEYWVKVHHPLIPTYASPEQVKERGYWDNATPVQRSRMGL